MRFAGSPKVASFLSSSPDYGLTGQQGLATNTELDANAKMNEAKLLYQEEKAAADIEAAEYGAQARADIAGANAESGMISGIAGAASKFLGGLGSKSNSGNSSAGGSGFGSFGDYSSGFPTTRNYSGMNAPSVPFASTNLGISSPPPVNMGGGFGFGGGINFSS